MTVYISPNPGKEQAADTARRAAQLLLMQGAVVLMRDDLKESCYVEGVQYLPLEECLPRTDVYYSGFIPVNEYDNRLPALKQPPLVRENRLYQADWLLRFYQFKVDEIVNDAYPDLDLEVDPKLGWALRHPEQFPVDINKADYEMLLRVPGIGVKSAKLIVVSRRYSRLGTGQLKKMGVVMKKAQYFITCHELPVRTINEVSPEVVRQILIRKAGRKSTDDRQLILQFKEES